MRTISEKLPLVANNLQQAISALQQDLSPHLSEKQLSTLTKVAQMASTALALAKQSWGVQSATIEQALIVLLSFHTIVGASPDTVVLSIQTKLQTIKSQMETDLSQLPNNQREDIQRYAQQFRQLLRTSASQYPVDEPIFAPIYIILSTCVALQIVTTVEEDKTVLNQLEQQFLTFIDEKYKAIDAAIQQTITQANGFAFLFTFAKILFDRKNYQKSYAIFAAIPQRPPGAGLLNPVRTEYYKAQFYLGVICYRLSQGTDLPLLQEAEKHFAIAAQSPHLAAQATAHQQKIQTRLAQLPTPAA